MAISEKRAAAFEALGAEGMKRWLRTAGEQRFLRGRFDRYVFEPLELFIGTRDSLASDIASAYEELSPTGQSDFRDALAGVLGELEARCDYAEMWRFLMELAWLLPAPGAVKVMEIRFTDAFFDALCETDSELYHEMFTFMSDTAITGSGAAHLMRRMIDSSRFDFHYARHALLRLCEISPDEWTQHLALTRDKLHQMFRNMEDAEQVQDELAVDILAVIRFDRLAAELANTETLLDLSRAAWWEKPSDIWLWRALVERTRSVLVPEPPAIAPWIALAERPNDRRPIANIEIEQWPEENIEIEQWPEEERAERLPSRPEKESSSLVDRALGPSFVH